MMASTNQVDDVSVLVTIDSFDELIPFRVDGGSGGGRRCVGSV